LKDLVLIHDKDRGLWVGVPDAMENTHSGIAAVAGVFRDRTVAVVDPDDSEDGARQDVHQRFVGQVFVVLGVEVVVDERVDELEVVLEVAAPFRATLPLLCHEGHFIFSRRRWWS